MDDHGAGVESEGDLESEGDAAGTPSGEAWTPLVGRPPAGEAPVRGGEDGEPLGRGSTLGRYVVLELVGAGGMGRVYTAYDPQLDRKIALKILHPGPAGHPRRREVTRRLLREAQALARLSHPNVITVHDAGAFGDQVFLAMEYVRGVTLEAWLHRHPRTRRQILAAFQAAGRGLAAAHEAGLVHRDFKSSNVMVGEDGRVLVLDFGLALAQGPPEGGGDGPVIATEELRRPAARIPRTPLTETLTRTGAALGTPAFMAPEQLAGRPVGVAADQFSFCVALYAALYDQLPFAGSGEGAGRWKLAPPPQGSRVPARLRHVLRRGLSYEAVDRYPSMDALLVELVDDPRVRRRRWLAAAAVLALLTTALVSRQRAVEPREGLCRGAGERFGRVWNAERRQAVEASFTSSGKPYAATAWRATRTALDDYRDHWVAMHTDACEATRLRGEQSVKLLDLRMGCLDQRLREVDALTDLLRRGGDPVVERAAQATNALLPLSACADTNALLAPLELPADAATRERVGELRGLLADAKAHQDAGAYEHALELAKSAARQARELGYWPLTAEALLRQGMVEEAGESQAAAATLRQALLAAQASRHHRVAVEAFIRLVRVVGYQQADFAGGYSYAEHAEVLLAHLSERGELAATLADHVGVLHYQEGDYERAEEHHRQALRLWQRLRGPSHPEVARTLARLSSVLVERGLLGEARECLERALAIHEEVLGDGHPDLASSLDRLGLVFFDLGDYARAEAHHRRALAIRERALGPEHPKVATSLIHLANVDSTRGEREAALAKYRRALAIYRASFGPEHPHVASALSNIGLVLLHLGNGAGAADHYTRALTIHEKVYGGDHPTTAMTLFNLASVLDEAGDPHEALGYHLRALKIWDDSFDDDHPLIAHGLSGAGHAYLALSRPEPALPLLERALAIWETAGGEPAYLAGTRFELARALTMLGRDRARALGLARAAEETLRRAPESFQDKLEDVERWLDEHAS